MNTTMPGSRVYVLTFEYSDKSGFYVCGLTRTFSTAVAWLNAGDGEHKVYEVDFDEIVNATTGHRPWGSE